jgi:hypothetical protein
MEDTRPLPRVAAGLAPVYITEKLIRRACGDTKLALSRIKRLVLKGGVTIRGTLRKIDFGTCTGRLECLEHLDLSNNEIVRIEHLEQFAGVLRELSLANNKLSRMNNLAPVASTLEVLNLNGNAISRIPEAVGALRCLRVLGLASNRLSMLDDFKRLAELPALAQLEVRDNPATQTLSARDFVVFTLPALDMLDRRLLTQRDRDAAMKRFGAAATQRVRELEEQLEHTRANEARLEQDLRASGAQSSAALRGALERARQAHEERERELEEQVGVFLFAFLFLRAVLFASASPETGAARFAGAVAAAAAAAARAHTRCILQQPPPRRPPPTTLPRRIVTARLSPQNHAPACNSNAGGSLGAAAGPEVAATVTCGRGGHGPRPAAAVAHRLSRRRRRRRRQWHCVSRQRRHRHRNRCARLLA